MVKVVGIRFRNAGKIYYFGPGKLQLKAGMHAIVETARGVEMGTVMTDPREVSEESVVQPLKPVIRIATEQDEKQVEKNRQKEKEAFKICLEKIAKHKLDMEYKGNDLNAPTKEEMEGFVKLFQEAGFSNTKIGG